MTNEKTAAKAGPPDAEDPSDERLTSVIAGRSGCDQWGDDQFQVADDARICCLTCRQSFAAADQPADDVDRLEGASDPADMAMLLPVRCPCCAASGPLVLRYGPEASAEEAELLLALDRRPADRRRPPSSPTSCP